MRVTLFGHSGQVGHALRRALPNDWSLTTLGRAGADFADPDKVAASLEGLRADLIINAAAYTAVDKAESEPALAQAVNGDSPGEIAKAAAAKGIPFLHISTDYVFDGAGHAPHRPGDGTHPLGVYGRTKLAGELAVRRAGGHFAILRTSWVFSATGANFVRTMLRLGAARGEVSVVADQIGGPTAAADIAHALVVMGKSFREGKGLSGIYHFSGVPEVSWADFARTIFATAGMKVTVRDIPTSAYPTPARRPMNSRLDCSATQAVFGIARPDWRLALRPVVHELRKQEGLG